MGEGGDVERTKRKGEVVNGEIIEAEPGYGGIETEETRADE